MLLIKLMEVMVFQHNYSNTQRSMPSKFCSHYVNKSGRPNSGYRTGKGQSSSQFPRRVKPKNVLIIRQLHSYLMLGRSCLKSCTLGFSIIEPRTSRYPEPRTSRNQAVFRKGIETTWINLDQIANIHWIIEKAREFQKMKTKTKHLSLLT